MWFLNLKIPEMIKSFSVSLTSTWRPINCIHDVKRKWKRLKGSFSSLTKSRNVFIVLQKGKWEKIEDDQTCTFWFSPISLRISELTTVLVIDLGEKRKTELWNCWLSKIYTNQASYCSYCSCVCVYLCVFSFLLYLALVGKFWLRSFITLRASTAGAARMRAAVWKLRSVKEKVGGCSGRRWGSEWERDEWKN